MEKNKKNSEVFAAIDLGSNSCRLLVIDKDANVLHRESQATALIKDMQNNMICDEAMQRVHTAFVDFNNILQKYEKFTLRAIATEACRRANNSDVLQKLIKDNFGINLDIIDAETEAKLNLSGAITHVCKKSEYVVIFDVGGGSTEICFATNEQNPKIIYSISMPLGSRASAQEFELAEYDAENEKKLQNKVQDYVKTFLEKTDFAQYKDQTICVATSSTALRLAAIIANAKEYDRAKFDGTVLEIEDVNHKCEELKKCSVKQLAQNPAIGEKRSQIILAAMVIFQTIANMLGVKEIVASLQGAQEALVEELRNGK